MSGSSVNHWRRAIDVGQSETLQPISPVAQLNCTQEAHPGSRFPCVSPCTSRYVELRYYRGSLAPGVLLAGAFSMFYLNMKGVY
jgi:hypothetical protein